MTGGAIIAGVSTLTRRRLAAGGLALLTALISALGGRPADAHPAAHPGGLPLGDADLVETRTSQRLAPGVTLTRIVRGTDPAPVDQIGTTTRGPWRVDVLTIDPRRAHGHLVATYGPDLAAADPTSALVQDAGALAGVNASFFTFTANPQYPGEPVGLGIYGGRLLSEPSTDPAETDLLVDAATGRLTIGKLSWTGTVRGRSGAPLALTAIDHPPVVPAGCATLPDQTQCPVPGDTVEFTPEFAPATPSGPGVEVVLDRAGRVVSVDATRGTALAAGQTSIQATGFGAAALLALAGTGRLTVTSALIDQDGHPVRPRPDLYAVDGRYPLTRGGAIVVPAGTGSFFDRNPRTIAGTTRDGRIVLVAIDGRQTTSVGTTMAETAAVADALGLADSVNLDGGGSTTMVAAGALINQPSGGTERAVGDALVYVP